MLSQLRSLFGRGPATDYPALLRGGALVIDVRSEGEFRGGHIAGARNIPLDRLAAQAGKLPKDKPLLLCCASGIRSAAARKLLLSKGFERVYNGGGWLSLQAQLGNNH